MSWLRLVYGLIFAIHAMACLPAHAGMVVPASGLPGRVFASAATESGDERVRLSWSFAKGSLEAGLFAGVRVYRLLDGDEMRFRVEPLKLVAEIGVGTDLDIPDLGNGSRAIFVLSAHDAGGRPVERLLLFGFPGSRAKDAPPKVENLYAVSGPFAVSVFWDRLEQINIAGYEILRKRADESEFTTLGRMDKVVYVPGERTGAVLGGMLPEVQPGMFRDRTALPGLEYVYQVRAVDAEGRTGPGAETGPVGLGPDRSPLPEEVLVLAIWNSSDSKRIARHYAERRGIPDGNILVVSPYSGKKFRNRQILDEVREHLLDKGLAGKVRVIVTTFGMPLGDGQRGLDSMLTDLFGRYSWGRVMGSPNPAFGQNMHHDPTFGTYLVSRLDGPTPDIAMGLVDKAVQAAGVDARSGPAFFSNPDFKKECLVAAERHGVSAVFKDVSFTKNNTVPDETMWFFGSGHPYRRIRGTPWPAGSVAGFLKSDTLAEIRGGAARYWVQGLLEEGVTATFGAAIEPYVQGYTRGDILLDRFWSGRYTFAEAFAMATPTVRWAMCAVGDPLYKLAE